MKRTICGLIFCLVLMLFFLSCDKSVSPSDDTATFSGIVRLVDIDGNENISNEVTIAVFEKDESDITWDYRLNNPVLVTNTNSEGLFLYSADEDADYLVVFLKEGYSVKGIMQTLSSFTCTHVIFKVA